MEKTSNFKKFKKSVGRDNHYFITAYIGIEEINGNTEKPESLSTKWNPKSIKSSKDLSKLYLRRNALISACTLFEGFISDTINSSLKFSTKISADEINKLQNDLSIYKNVTDMIEIFEIEKNYTYYLWECATFWRNNIVHNNKKPMGSLLKSELKSFGESYKNKNSGLDINLLITNYDAFKEPTFKEVLSIMTCLRQFAELIDKKIASSMNEKEYLQDILQVIHNDNKMASSLKIEFGKQTKDNRIYFKNLLGSRFLLDRAHLSTIDGREFFDRILNLKNLDSFQKLIT